MNCPKCGYALNLGRELQKLSWNKPRKAFSDEEKEKRRLRLAVNRAKRWPVKPDPPLVKPG